MKNTYIGVALAVVVMVVGGAYYLVSKNAVPSATSPAPVPAVSVSNAPAVPVPARASVRIKNFSFNPSALSVKVGTEVVWVNDDAAPHTVTADAGNLFNSATLAPGQSFSFIFATPGTVHYHCNIHPMMKGSVVVQ